MDALWDGVGAGVRLLLDSGTDAARRLQRELGGQHAPDQVGRLGTESGNGFQNTLTQRVRGL